MADPTSGRSRFDRFLNAQLRALTASVLGVGTVTALVVVFGQVSIGGTAPKALCLMLPVVVIALVGGRVASYVVATAAALGIGYVVPPFGSPSVALQQDVVALVVFLIVAFVVGTLVARRIELLAELERQHALLLRSVSHDLRTPLASIRAASTELLDNDAHTPAARARMLTIIDNEAERLNRMVANLLDLSRVEAGTLVPRTERVEIASVVRTCANRACRLWPATRIEVDAPDELDPIEGDPTLLDQVISNLLENAVRHGAAGGRVRIAALDVDGGVMVSVDDDGPGVAEADREHVFDTFQTVGRTAGSGIGLSICKAVIDAHGGSVEVTTSPLGGARFEVRLPR